jgi:SAM-dependent methyltransferase
VLGYVGSIWPIRKLTLDICNSPLPQLADIILCYNVLQVSSNPEKGLKNLLDSVSPRGLLSLDTGCLFSSIEDRRYTRLGENLYQRE